MAYRTFVIQILVCWATAWGLRHGKLRSGERDTDEADASWSTVKELEAKAVARIFATSKGPDMSPGNPDLKLLLTSSGLMPKTAPEQLQAYDRLASSVPGRGVLYLLDAKLLTLQFASTIKDPEKNNNEPYVAYRRQPDEPGGEPVRDAHGDLVMKNQSELTTLGFGSVIYSLKNFGQYSNGHLSMLLQEDAPVYFSYLEFGVKGGDHPIFLGRGRYRNGTFEAINTNGELLKDADYEKVWNFNDQESDLLRKVSVAEFTEVVNSVQTVWSCGGVTFNTIQALAPYHHSYESKDRAPNRQNLYGLAILDRVKEGKVVYIGQSAGTVALGYAVGPLTIDPSRPSLERSPGDSYEEKLDVELAREWLFPGIGEYLGIPYRMIFRPHLRFDTKSCQFGINVAGVNYLKEYLEYWDEPEYDMFALVMSDYNYHTGQGDLVEVSRGNVTYRVGFSDEKGTLSASCMSSLKTRNVTWSSGNEAIRLQPRDNPESGWSFNWSPADGEVWAAGPNAKHRFRIYASTSGPYRNSRLQRHWR